MIVTVERGLEIAGVTFDKRGRSSEKCAVGYPGQIRCRSYRLFRKKGIVQYRFAPLCFAEVLQSGKIKLVTFRTADYREEVTQAYLNQIK